MARKKAIKADGWVYRYKIKTFRVTAVKENVDPPLSWFLDSLERAEAAARMLLSTLDADKEHCILLTVDQTNKLTGYKVISTGSLTSSLVHPREVWRSAIHLCAAGVVLAHNHPSGNPKPSPEDYDVTGRLKETADVMGVRFLDHIIIGDKGGYFSFSAKWAIDAL
jgi:DNA repair protein RadC